jgi:diaminopimelate epimerase
VHLSKHHGLGNDFLIALDDANPGPLALGPEVARRLCDRHTGIGADGLIHGARPAPGSTADVVFSLWNADGGVAEVSGNGLRCLAQAVARRRGAGDADLVIDTLGGPRRATVRATADPVGADVEVEMGPVGAGPVIPPAVAERLVGRAATASIGNPHLVVLVDEPTEIDLAVEGPVLEAAFAAGVNVEFIAARAADVLDLVVWERGSGITQACGSGACAAASLAHAWGLVGERVQVRMPGGTAVVTLGAEGVRLAGPATYVADVEVPDA